MRNINNLESSFYHYGASGETRYLTDDLGAVTDTYYYEVYGSPLASTGTTYNPHQYGGKFGYYKDEASDVLLATWRWYSPSQYRWLSRDPIKFDGGSNVYQYVVGNPVMFVDPLGNSPVTNISPRPVPVSGNPGLHTGVGDQIEFDLLPGQSCGLFNPINGVRDVDAIDFNGDGKADNNSSEEHIHGTSIGHGKDPTSLKPIYIECKPGSFAPGCDIIIVDKPSKF